MEDTYARLQDRGDHDDPPLPTELLRGTRDSLLDPDNPVTHPKPPQLLKPDDDSEVVAEFKELDEQLLDNAREEHPEWDWD